MPYIPISRSLSLLRRQAAFTLVETMIVVSIAAIMLAVGMPSFTAFMNDSRVSGYANEFMGAITLARAESVARSRLVTMCRSANAETATPTCTIGANWNTGWLVFVKNTSAGDITKFEANDVILLRQGAMKEKTKALSDPAISSITFNQLGEGVGGGAGFDARFNFSFDGKRPREICVNRNGRVKVVQGAIDGSVC